MRAWLLRRAVGAVLTLLAVLTLSFVAIRLAPGTPFMPNGDRPPLDSVAVARLQARFGLDRRLSVQYVDYLAALARGEFGESFSQRRPVSAMLADAIPNTLLLSAFALAIDFALGMLIALAQALRQGSRRASLLTNLTLLLYSLPTFWLGLVLLLVFGEWLRWFPIGGVVDPAMHESMNLIGRAVDRLHHLALPALTLGVIGAAGTARFQRAALADVLRQDFILTARAKGVSRHRVIWRHVVRNALLPYFTLLGLALPFLITGAVVVESVFAWPGMGKLAADAIATRDYPVVTATALLASLFVVLGSVAADALCWRADPRVQRDGVAG